MAFTAVVAAAAVATSVISAKGAKKQGQAQQQANNYNAAIARQNAQISRDNAAYAARQSNIAGRLAQGAARARIGMSGVTAEGSPLAALEMGARNATQDELLIKHQGELDAISFENEAQLQQFSGKAARTAASYASASSLLGGISGAASAGYTGAANKGWV